MQIILLTLDKELYIVYTQCKARNLYNKAVAEMKDSPLIMTMLFDFYGDVLTDKQKDFFDLYHNHDMSLGEIAANESITRQGVRDVIVRATHVLRSMEEKLGLVARYAVVRDGLAEIRSAAAAIEELNNRSYGSTQLRDYAQRIQTLADEIAERT